MIPSDALHKLSLAELNALEDITYKDWKQFRLEIEARLLKTPTEKHNI